jgi:hypothetical protein
MLPPSSQPLGRRRLRLLAAGASRAARAAVFLNTKPLILRSELQFYIDNLLHDPDFENLQSISDLARLIVDRGKHNSYPLVSAS